MKFHGFFSILFFQKLWTSQTTLSSKSLNDLISNSPYCLPYSSCDVSLENLVLDQTNNSLMKIFLYSHHLSAWYCIDIVGEILSWSLMRVNGLTPISFSYLVKVEFSPPPTTLASHPKYNIEFSLTFQLK